MRISIDQDRCQGHAMCHLLAPTLFDVDDDGRGVPLVGEVPPDAAAAARVVVARCPEGAILLDDGGQAPEAREGVR